MPKTLLDSLEPTTRVLKRAQYEAFEFSLLDGDVCVRNNSHQNPSEHEYRVTVVDGVPAACECPADAAYGGPCKHRVAVAIRPRILDIATKMRAVAYGGVVTDGDRLAGQSSDTDTTQCDNEGLAADFPCSECVCADRRSFPK
ncbi:SWIM zinc finger family protein [Halobellus inordinatus]|uniref:SWIM zinc finger family protein n=1 Tax=Halobellus inordinatus TaxID=1126236 RepID=UPI00210BE338|nr:SWIM zinc finger family protein [Halobellus inordinatus]